MVSYFSETLLVCCLLVLLYAYGAEVLFGIPTWLHFKRYRVTSYWAYLLIGAVIGLIVFLIVGGNPTSIDWLYLGVPCVAAAVASAGAFRLIAARTIPLVLPPDCSEDS